MLKVRTRQKYLKTLGFYKGKVTGIEGKLTRKAYLALQKAYFKPKDCDGKYGRNTDILLINAIRVHAYAPNFSLEEFKCECNGRYCTGYPVILDREVLKNIQKMREYYNRPVQITSGLRCGGYNKELSGSVSGSRHTRGKAVDFFINGKTTTEQGRLSVMKHWMSLQDAHFTYCYLPTKYRSSLEKNATYMGNAIHGDVN